MLKQIQVLDKVCKELNIDTISREEGCIYVMTMWTDYVSMQGSFNSRLASRIIEKFPDAKSFVKNSGFVEISFVADGLRVEVILT
jgi:hypothetical protein